MKYDSIGFDLDGTLWSSIKSITKAWDITAEKFNVPLPDETDMKGVMGLNRINLMNKLYPDMPFKRQMDFFKDATIECNIILNQQGGELFPQLEETLDILHQKAPLYIVSNCQEGYIDNFLDYHKLRKYFVDYECAGTKDCSKGELIKLVLNRNNFKSSIYVGDTQGDRNAAKEAEIPFIFAAYGFGQVDSTDFTINKFSDMVNFVR